MPELTGEHERTTRRDRLLAPLRIGTFWGAAVFVFLWLAYNRHGLKDPLGGDFYLSNADVLRVVSLDAAVAVVAGWILSAPIFLFLRSRKAARVTEVVIAAVGAAIALAFAVLGT
jgi:hypothetical protein